MNEEPVDYQKQGWKEVWPDTFGIFYAHEFTRFCEWCGEKFITKIIDHFCCCAPCSQRVAVNKSAARRKWGEALRTKTKYVRACLECARDFETDSKKKFICSHKCAKKRKMNLQNAWKMQARRDLGIPPKKKYRPRAKK